LLKTIPGSQASKLAIPKSLKKLSAIPKVSNKVGRVDA